MPAPTAPPRSRSWIPIRSLRPRHRERIAAHLLALSPDDRYLRFGYPATDTHIRKYVAELDFERDELFGIFNRGLRLIAFTHLAYAGPTAEAASSRIAEFGVSVLATSRGKGYAARLFEHAILHARNRGVDHLLIHTLTQNAAMLRIARNAGATVQREGADAQALLKLPAENFASHLAQWVDNGASELNYRLKVNANIVDGLLDAVDEVRLRFGDKPRSASQ